MITLEIDTRDLTRDLDNLQRKQIPFAVARALNQLAKEGQANVRASLRSNFTINASKLAFIERTVRIGRDDWARKDRLAVRIGINEGERGAGGLGSKDRSQLLGRHEKGGSKTADPMQPFFIPTKELRSGAYDIAARKFYPASLRLAERRTTSGTLPAKSRLTKRGKVVLMGKQRTFVIDARATADPRAWGVFQRVGPYQRDIRMLWAFRTQINIRPRLGFYRTFEQTLHARMTEVLGAALASALDSARR